MSAPQQKGDGWRRDWPMLAGLAVSASLVFASTVVGAPSGDEPAPRPASKAAADTGSISADAAEAPTAEAAETETATAKAKPAKKKKKAKAATTASASAAAETTDTTPAKTAPATTTPRPTSSKPDTPLVLNVKGTSGVARHNGIEMSFNATSHTPVMGSLFTIAVTGMKGAKPLAGTVKVVVVHKGQVVGDINSGKFASGKYRHSIRWPKESVDQPLVLKTTIEAAGTTQTFLFAVRVRAAG